MAGSRPLVLVVDDDRWLRRVLKEVLSVEGYRVAEACSALGALRLLNAVRPAAIVLDQALPHVSGLDLLWRCNIAHGSEIPVIIASAYADLLPPEALVQAECVLQKPVDLDHLLMALDRVTASRKKTTWRAEAKHGHPTYKVDLRPNRADGAVSSSSAP